MNEEIDETTGVSRRDMLRKTAIVGGALVWTAPAVQSLAGPAFAQTAGSPGGQEVCTYYAISVEIDNATGAFTCSEAAQQPQAGGSTDCIKAGSPNYAAAIPGGCAFFIGVTVMNGNWTLMLKPETDANRVQGFSKCASASCTPVTAKSDGAMADTFVFTPCPKPAGTGNGTGTQGISNVQLVFCVPR